MFLSPTVIWMVIFLTRRIKCVLKLHFRNRAFDSWKRRHRVPARSGSQNPYLVQPQLALEDLSISVRTPLGADYRISALA